MLNPGEPIDVWIVDRPLGYGGMGSVYQCHNRNAPRILAAVKVLDATMRGSVDAKARFVREAEILYALDHPNIVKVRNIRMDTARPYLEMELIDGIDLERRLRAGPLALRQALPLFEQVADALAYLHGKGVRHRDVKPGNIVVRADGTVKLVDFGIATEGDALRLGRAEPAFGSLAYVPPEWLDPAGIDHALWDVYSTGVVFWEVLTGRDAFEVRDAAPLRDEMVRVLARKQHTDALRLDDAPAALRELVADMTRVDPKRRVASFTEVRDRLRRVAEALPPRTAAERTAAERTAAERTAAGWPVAPDHADRGPATPATRSARSRRTTRPSAELAPTVPLPAPDRGPEPRPALAPAPPPPAWRSSIPGASTPRGDDPSYAIALSRRWAWVEVRWESPTRFATWVVAQLLNYTLLLPEGAATLPIRGPIRVLLSHDDVHVDCAAHVQAAGEHAVSYRLDLDVRDVQRLEGWLQARRDAALVG